MESGDQQVNSPLHIACINGDEESCVKIIGKGGDVNGVDASGCTPIQLGAAGGFVNIVKLLLHKGAKAEIQDLSHGNTSLHEAGWRGYSRLVKILSTPQTINVQNYGGFTPLHLSCQAGHNQSTRELLLAGADPNLVNTYGDTPLHTAIRYGHAGVGRILLSARCAVDKVNKNGDSALHIASAMGRKKLTKILLSSGCSAELRNHQDETPLDIALRKKFTDIETVIRSPPEIITPMQRDEMRASTIKLVNPSSGKTKTKGDKGGIILTVPKASPGHSQGASGRVRLSLAAKQGSKDGDGKGHGKTKRFGSSTKLGSKGSKNCSPNSKDKSGGHCGSGGCKGRREECSRGSGQPSSLPEGGGNSDVPWSPYGCHYHPNPGAFPAPNIDSLPKEPLTTGELYYLDLAGNIHKGPMGVSEGCYCNTLLSQSQNPNTQSMTALNQAQPPQKHSPHHHHHQNNQESQDPGVVVGSNKYEAKLNSIENQLSNIAIDTQAQLSSLHSMFHERFKDANGDDFNESKLKDWVKQYRRFRKEISKNPKTLNQANELLSSASALLSTRLPSPVPPDSETDSGI